MSFNKRIIKFRAWDKKEEQMVHDVNILSSSKHLSAWISDNGGGGFFNPTAENYHVMQATGLLDKNGKEIYEGDIVYKEDVYEWGIFENWYLVEWKECKWVMPRIRHKSNGKETVERSEFSSTLWPTAHDRTKISGSVVSNIYENPELKTTIMDKPNNPPAFPVEGMANGDSVSKMAQGMTLLDYFAAQAMQGIMSDIKTEGMDYETLALNSYEIAQAMLKEREKHL